MFTGRPGRDRRHAAPPAPVGEVFNGENDQGNGDEEAAELGQEVSMIVLCVTHHYTESGEKRPAKVAGKKVLSSANVGWRLMATAARFAPFPGRIS